MNNADFKALLSHNDRPNRHNGSPSSSHQQLGSREKPNTLMMPRSVRTARPGSTQNKTQSHGTSSRKAKSIAAPKGTALAAGYVDRASARKQQDNGEEGAERNSDASALEEQLKSGQIDRETFQRLSADIFGGDVKSTHLVKGLDRKLLERVRRGENLWVEARTGTPDKDSNDAVGSEKATEDELELLETKSFEQVQREHEQKKAGKAAQAVRAGVKRSRNDIIAQLKAQRMASGDKKSAEGLPQGSKFRRLDNQMSSSRLEVDSKGREVLITIDENGKEKRKVRKIASTNPATLASTTAERSADNHPLPAPAPVAEIVRIEDNTKDVEHVKTGMGGLEEDDDHDDDDDDGDGDDDIFKDAGHDYNPLGIVDDGDGSSASESETETSGSKQFETNGAKGDTEFNTKQAIAKAANEDPSSIMPSTRNYFGSSSIPTESELNRNPFADPTVLASLKRASELSKREEAREKQKQEEGRVARRALADRDFEDIDMGFGSSRFDDEEDENGMTEFSEWKGIGAAEDEKKKERGRGGQGPRKRGKKKRKGDKDSASDVLRVIEGRQKS